MKITINNEYKSIKALGEEIELPDFIILTGKNGSGKTHFLEGIKNGAIQVISESNNLPINSDDVLYFDYTNFLISDTSYQDETKKQRKLNKYKKIKKDLLNLAEEELRSSDIDGFGTATKLYEENRLLYGVAPEIQIANFYFIQGYGGDHYSKLYNCEKAIKFTQDILNNSEEYKEIKELEKKHNMSVHQMNESHIPNEIPFIKNDFIQYVSDWEKARFNDTTAPNKNSEEEKNIYATEIIDPLISIEKNLHTLGYENFNITRTNQIKEARQLANHVSDIKVEKENVLIDTDNLSSGEKILFGLSVFLSNKQNLDSQVLLLDEIDATLHPSMSKTLLNSLRNLADERDLKIIMTTHSPSTVAFANEDEICVIDHTKDNQIIEKVNKNSALDAITEGIIRVGERSKIVIVEGNQNGDQLFYKNFYEAIYTNELIEKIPTLVFTSLGDATNGSCTKIINFIENSNAIEIKDLWGLVDGDTGTIQSECNSFIKNDTEKVIHIPRYCKENYEYDLVGLLATLVHGGYYNGDIEFNNITQVNQDNIQTKIDFIVNKLHQKISEDKNIKIDTSNNKKVELQYKIKGNDFDINIPKWYLYNSGKHLRKHIHEFIQGGGNNRTSTVSCNDIQNIMIRYKIFPMCLVNTIKYIVEAKD